MNENFTFFQLNTSIWFGWLKGQRPKSLHSHILPALRFSKSAIDYFLYKFVFPREMIEFLDKLSASGWDIGDIKTCPTVGLSGTNDSRKTLPFSIKQLDRPEQKHTNATS